MPPTSAPAPAAVLASTPTPTLLLTIRFSTGVADLDLDVPSPQSTTVVSLKHTLRGRLASNARIRLIYQGRILPDGSVLSSVIRGLPDIPGPVSSAPLLAGLHLSGDTSSSGGDAAAAAKGKGKAKANAERVVRIFLNCSIGDELSAEDLAKEEAAARRPPELPKSAAPSGPGGAADRDRDQVAPRTTVTPRPRGFDRLLQAGFTPSEVTTLRTQFATIHADRFEPDEPPSPDTMRGLEDAWIDSNASMGGGSGGRRGGAGGQAGETGPNFDEDVSGLAHSLDLLIRGMTIGFFFPLGSLTWLLRHGIWSDKWQVFVGAGVVLSILVGIVLNITREE